MSHTTQHSKIQVIEMIKLDIEGVSRTEIARRFDMTKGRVSQILNSPESKKIKAEMSRQVQSTIDRVAKRMKEKVRDHV